MRAPNLEIYKDLPDDRIFNSRDVLEAFGYGRKTKASCLVTNGLLPPPSKINKSFAKHAWNRSRTNRLLWTLGDLRKVESELILNKTRGIR